MGNETPARKEGRYHRLLTPCDLSYTTVIECLSNIRPAEIYHIYAGKSAFLSIRSLMQLEWQKGNPFCPVVNISFDDTLLSREWYIAPRRFDETVMDPDECWGSEGV